MSQRRSRRSLGPPLAQDAVEPPVHEQLALFDDFRRRHSRQNRDIIKENITRRAAIKQKDELIERLQAQVLELQTSNHNLRRQLKDAQNTALWSDDAKMAFDGLVSAVEVFRSARDRAERPAAPVTQAGEARQSLRNVGPRRREKPRTALDTLSEESPQPPSTKKKARDLRRQSIGDATSHLQMPQSPSPSPKQSPSPKSSLNKDPTLFLSPSPKHTPKRRRRRESGLVLQNGVSLFPSGADSPGLPPVDSATETRDEASLPGVGRMRPASADASWDEGSQVILAPEEAQRLADEASVEAVVTPTSTIRRKGREPSVNVKDVAARLNAAAEANAIAGPSRQSKISSPPAGWEDVDSSSPLSSVPSLPASSSPALPPAVLPLPTSKPTALPTLSTRIPRAVATPSPEPARTPDVPIEAMEDASEPLDFAIGRVRRSRASVSYKEPSLNKKMRKPDGFSLDSAMRRKSGLPRSSKIPCLTTDESEYPSAQDLDLPETPAPRPSAPSPRRASASPGISPSGSPDSRPIERKAMLARDALKEIPAPSNDLARRRAIPEKKPLVPRQSTLERKTSRRTYI